MNIKYGISMEDFDKEFAVKAKEVFDIYSSNDLDAMLRVVESAIRSMTTDDDKNELIITTTALRIGKIKLLANGLGREGSTANAENRKSLLEYQKQLKQDQAALGSNTMTYAPTKQVFAEMFKNSRVLEEDNSSKEENSPVQVDLSDSGDHLSNEQLESLLNSD